MIQQSNQGVQYVRNNIAYWVCYDSDYRGIYTFDVTTGEIHNIITLPRLINGYRLPGEYQSVIYNNDTDDWFLVSRFVGSGVSGKAGFQIFEMGLFKAVSSFDITDGTVANTNTRLNITVNQGANFVASNIRNFICIDDAINACRTANIYGELYFTGDNMVIGTYDICGFNGNIYGTSDTHLEFKNVRVFNSNIRFSYCDFTGSVTHPYITGDTGNMAIFNSIFKTLVSTVTDKLLVSDSICLQWTLKVHSLRSLFLGAQFITNSTLTNSGFIQWYS